MNQSDLNARAKELERKIAGQREKLYALQRELTGLLDFAAAVGMVVK